MRENARKELCNTYPVPTGGRACRICRREYLRRWRARQAQERVVAHG